MLPLDLGDDAADDARTKLGGDRLQPAASNVTPLAKR
jgi:hypothetical protein